MKYCGVIVLNGVKMSKTLYYKNNQRNLKENVQRVPEHRRMGIEPIKNGFVQNGPKPFVTPVIPANKRKQEPQDISQHHILSTNSSLPPNFPPLNHNIYTTMDNEVVEDEQLNMFAPLESHDHLNDDHAKNSNNDLANVLEELVQDSYVLMVNGSAICSGPLLEIEDEVNALIFGTHELCQGVGINPNDLYVLKKVKIKVGVHLE